MPSVTGTQLLVLGLLVVAFAAGWFARGGGEAEEEATPAEEQEAVTASAAPATGTIAAAGGPIAPTQAVQTTPAPAPATPPQPRDVALRALDLATSAYDAALDRWLDEGAEITPAGRATLGELDRAIRRVDLAIGRLQAAAGDHEREASEARIALSALREAATLLGRFRDGHAIDAAADRQLRELEDDVAQARDALAGHFT